MMDAWWLWLIVPTSMAAGALLVVGAYFLWLWWAVTHLD